jgi:predicted TIM-barrel fold metal-dependent hydrolase
MAGFIDIVVNMHTPEVYQDREKKGAGVDDAFRNKTRSGGVIQGVSIEDYLKKMDAAGIERSLLIATRNGDLNVRGSYHLPYETVAAVCQKYPDRFSGLAGIDPTLGVKQLKELEYAVKELKFVGAHYYPHWFDMAPDHPYVFPIYGKCAELDVPIMMQVGHNLIYQSYRRLPSIGRPICLDRVAILYPELRLIGIHLGVPWFHEMISMAWKHENVFIGGDAYAPKHWPPEMVQFANTYGQDKFMFGTDWPVIDPVRAVEDVHELKFRPEPFRKIMGDTARRVFKLP